MVGKKLSKKYAASVEEEYVPNDIQVDIYCRTWQVLPCSVPANRFRRLGHAPRPS